MCRVTINNKAYFCEKGTLLSELLTKEGFSVSHPCGGRGICGKCVAEVNGEEVLCCRYTVEGDVTVRVIEQGNIVSEDGIEIAESCADNVCLVLDLGTTAVTLAQIDKKSGKAVNILNRPNAQGAFGADVISRIRAAAEHGSEALQSAVINQTSEMMRLMGIKRADELFVAGNTVMLHLFFGEDCTGLGTAPYTPVFLCRRECEGQKLGLYGVDKVCALPSIAAFAGADVTAGLNSVSFPDEGKYSILADLGTNAEIVLFSRDKMLVTSAAAGPCFEGVGIECGMSASRGAVYEYKSSSDLRTVEDAPAEGLCATGLIDVIAVMLKNGITDETGYMESTRFRISDRVYITQSDIRNFQTAKSAVYSGIMTLIKKAGITTDQIDKLFISGGFASKINVDNAVTAGIIPKPLRERCVPLKNTCLAGTIKYACERNDIDALIKNAEYTDLSCDESFAEAFIENMLFNT